jgi:predicted hotdog family 3-hydroxylacyl-ACP dehydratase
MLNRDHILGLIPHQGVMCLLDEVIEWSAEQILCRASSHLNAANPLRRRGRLSTICGLEYGLQSAALHGALLGGPLQPPGMLAALRNAVIHQPRLDDPTIGQLDVAARMEQRNAAALIYSFRLHAENGQPLAEGRAIIALPHA